MRIESVVRQSQPQLYNKADEPRKVTLPASGGSNASDHSRCCLDRTVNPAEVVVGEAQCKRRSQVLPLLTESVREPGKALARLAQAAHPADVCVLQKMGKPENGLSHPLRVLQLLLETPDRQDDARHGSRNYGSGMDLGRSASVECIDRDSSTVKSIALHSADFVCQDAHHESGTDRDAYNSPV